MTPLKESPVPLRILPPEFFQNADKLLKTMAPTAAQLEAIKEAGDAIRRQFDPIRRLMATIRFPTVDEMEASYLKSACILAKQGWYTDEWFSIPELHRLAGLFSVGKGKQADKFLLTHHEKRASHAIRTLAKAYPSRAALLRRALKAHREGDYDVAVLILLSQADGIGHDHIKASIYPSKRSRPVVKKKMESIFDGPLGRAYWAALLEEFPLNQYCDQGVYPKGQLNRHAVFHGYATDYGTRLNSAKALSWLLYVSTLKWAASKAKSKKAD